MATSRFPSDTKIWLAHIDFCKKMVNFILSWIFLINMILKFLEMELKYQPDFHKAVESEK